MRPDPERQLSPEQRRIRDLENQLAVERGAKDPEQEFEEPSAPGEDTIVIHFVADGFTALGQVWYRGQELEFTRDSRAYNDTCDRLGRSWLDLRADPAAQEARYGEEKFRPGPWPGKDMVAAADSRWEPLKPMSDGQRLTPTDEELQRAAAAEARRGRAAPRLSVA